MQEVWEECEACVYARGRVFFRQSANLESNLNEGTRDEACENYAA